MKKTNNASWKRIVAGTMAFMLTAAPMATGNDAFVQTGINIVAHADEPPVDIDEGLGNSLEQEITSCTLDISGVIAPICYITKIEYGDTTVTEDFANIQLPFETAVTITASGVLSFPAGLEVSQGGSRKNGYTYTFTIPADTASIEVNHVYDYVLRTDDENRSHLYGYDRNDFNDSAENERLLAILKFQDTEYLDDVQFNVEPQNDFALDEKAIEYRLLSKNGDVYTEVEQATEIGDYRVEAGATVGKAAFSLIADFKVTPRTYKNHTEQINVGFKSDTFTYNKKEQAPEIVITDSNALQENYTLKEGTDYELGYLEGDKFVSFKAEGAEKTLEQTNAGTYTVAVNFIGNYTGTASANWTIKKSVLPALTVLPDKNLVYSGAGHAVTVVAAGEGAKLPDEASNLFNVSYVAEKDLEAFNAAEAAKPGSAAGTEKYAEAPVNVGNYTAFVSIKNKNYEFAEGVTEYPSCEFEVTPKAIQVTPDASQKIYGEKDPESGFTCTTDDALATKENVNFNAFIGRTEGENAGTYPFVLKDAEDGAVVFGNYKISLAESKNVFTVNRKKIQPTITVADGTYTFTGEAITPAVTVKDGNTVIPSSEYKVSYTNNVNVGTATITITDTEGGNYDVAEATAEFKIQAASLAEATVTLPEEQYIADGTTEFEPQVTVNIGEKTLVADKDYTVSYANNINAGKATVTITGMGDYSDNETKSANFDILSKLDLSNVKDNITAIKVEEEDVTLNEDGIYGLETGKKITVYSKQSLALNVELADYDQDLDGYWYSFTIPAGTNHVTAAHERDYAIRTDGDKVYGTDRDLIDAQEILLATLAPENIYYLDDLSQKVYVKVEEGVGVTVANVTYRYEVVDGAELVNGLPVECGTYKLIATVKINDTFYYLTKEIVILPRDYEQNKEQVSVTVNNANTDYTGKAVIPEIVVTDSMRSEEEQTLVRGKDYELGYYTGEDEEKVFTAVTDDEAYFTGAESGSYSIIVKFMGNYSGEQEAKWTIGQNVLPTLTISPDKNLVYNNAGHPITVIGADGNEIAPGTFFIVLYGDAESTADSLTLTENAPINAGTYKAYIKLVDATNTAFANNQNTEITFTIARKDIASADITINSPAETILKETGWTYCDPITVTDNTTQNELTLGTDYSVERNRTVKASKNLEVLIIGEGNYTGAAYVDWTVIDGDTAKVNQEAAANVADLIEAVSEAKHTDSFKKDLEAAKAAYEALTDEQKALVENVGALDNAEQVYAAIDAVVAEIDNIGEVEFTPESKALIDAAREAYDKLADDAQKNQVENYRVLTYAEKLYNSMEDADAKAKEAEAELAKAAEEKAAVEKSAEDAVKKAEADKAAAEEAQKKAEDAQKVAEESAKVAEAAQKKAEEAEATALASAEEAQSKAAAAEEALKAAESGKAEEIAEAKAAKEAAEEAAKVAEAEKTAAESAIEEAKKAQATAEETAQKAVADKEAAEEAQKAAEEAVQNAIADKAAAAAVQDQEAANKVIALIKKIGKVENNNSCENAIIEAMAAYNTLTPAQQALVSNYEDLKNAQTTYESLPQTGMSGFHKAVAAFAALMGITGLGLIKKRKDEEE